VSCTDFWFGRHRAGPGNCVYQTNTYEWFWRTRSVDHVVRNYGKIAGTSTSGEMSQTQIPESWLGPGLFCVFFAGWNWGENCPLPLHPVRHIPLQWFFAAFGGWWHHYTGRVTIVGWHVDWQEDVYMWVPKANLGRIVTSYSFYMQHCVKTQQLFKNLQWLLWFLAYWWFYLSSS
jgi:hypothetical protein